MSKPSHKRPIGTRFSNVRGTKKGGLTNDLPMNRRDLMNRNIQKSMFKPDSLIILSYIKYCTYPPKSEPVSHQGSMSSSSSNWKVPGFRLDGRLGVVHLGSDQNLGNLLYILGAE